MKSAKEILEQLGFTKSAPDATKEAFLKNLIHAAQSPETKSTIATQARQKLPQKSAKENSTQLSFNFDEIAALANNSDKKVS